MTTKTHCGIRNFKKREDLRCKLREKPCNDSVSDRCAVNISPLQLCQKFRWIHSAGVDEALVTAALYLERDVKSTLLISSFAVVCEMRKSATTEVPSDFRCALSAAG